MKSTLFHSINFALILLVFVLLRIFFLFHYSGLWYLAVDEINVGNVAADLERNLVLPLQIYEAQTSILFGRLFMGLLSWPFRQVLGPNYLALKSAELIFQLVACLIWMVALWRLAGRLAAYVFGLFYAVAPPTWLHFTSMTTGTHAEQSLFVGLVFLMLVLAFGGGTPRARRHLFWLWAAGLFAGWGVFFNFTGLPTVLWLLLVFLLLNRATLLRRTAPAALAGLAMGLSLFLWNLAYWKWSEIFGIFTARQNASSLADAPAAFPGRSTGLFIHHDLPAVLKKFWHLVWEVLPASAGYSAGWANRLFFLLAAAGLVYGLVFAGRRWPREKALLVLAPLLYALIFLALTAVSGFNVGAEFSLPMCRYYGYRYLAPLFPIAFAGLALGAQTVWDSDFGRIWRKPALIAGLVLTLTVLNFETCRQVLRSPVSLDILKIRGNSALTTVWLVAANSSNKKDMFSNYTPQIPARHRHLFYQWLAETGNLVPSEARDAAYATDIMRGYGAWLSRQKFQSSPLPSPAEIDRLLKEHEDLLPFYRAEILMGAGLSIGRNLLKTDAPYVRLFEPWAAGRPDDYAALLKGLGLGVYQYDDSFAFPAPFWQGRGWQLRIEAEDLYLSVAPLAPQLLVEDRSQRQNLIRGFLEAGRLFDIGN